MREILFFLCMVAIGCRSASQPPSPVILHDLVYIHDTVRAKCDSAAILKRELFLANYKLEKVRFYVKIVKRKPSQKTFLLGWVDRSVN